MNINIGDSMGEDIADIELISVTCSVKQISITNK